MTKSILLCLLTFLAGVCIRAQEPVVEQAQIILRFDHEEGDKTIVEVQARTSLKLIPLNGEHPAPMAKNTIMLCRPYTQDGHLRLRCGMDHYGATSIAFQEK